MDTQTPQPTEPVKVPATVAATVSRDFGAFREASQAKQAGKPLPEVELPKETVTGDPTEAGRAVNAKQRRREREQQRINEQIRSGVEAATKAKDDEIAALKAKPAAEHVAAPVAAAKVEEPAKPIEPAVPAYKRIMGLPDAPKIEEFDGPNALGEYQAAVTLFVQNTLDQEKQHGEQVKSHAQKLIARDDSYRERVAPKGDMTFLKSLHPKVIDPSFRPVESLKRDAQGNISEPYGPLNILASKVVESEQAKPLLQHLSDHPEEMDRFAKLGTPDAVLIEFGRLVASLDPPKEETAPRPKLVTDASRPVTQFTARNAAPSDPVMKAVKDRDFRAFRAARLARDAAKRAS